MTDTSYYWNQFYTILYWEFNRFVVDVTLPMSFPSCWVVRKERFHLIGHTLVTPNILVTRSKLSREWMSSRSRSSPPIFSKFRIFGWNLVHQILIGDILTSICRQSTFILRVVTPTSLIFPGRFIKWIDRFAKGIPH